MLHAFERFHAASNGGRISARQERRGTSGQYVFDVVFTAQWNFVAARKSHFRTFVAKKNLPIAQKRSGGNALLPAEPENVRLGRHAARDFRIVGVEDGYVALSLIFEHAHLRVGVLLERNGAIEMVRRQIEQHSDFRPKLFNSFE